MSTALAACLSLVFVALALWHFGMALFPAKGRGSAIPSVSGRPLFVPSSTATVAVGLLLLVFAVLVSATAGILQTGIARTDLSWACLALSLGLLVRAVGDFRYVGLFKRVRGSRFATMDTLVYSPLCLLLAVGVAVVALGHGV